MALTSTTGTVVSDTVQYDIAALGTARGNGVIAYIDYTKGTESLTMKMKFAETQISDTYFYDTSIDTNVVTIKVLSFTATGLYKLPIPISSNEDSLILEFLGLVDGTLNVEFSINNAYA